MHVVAGEAVDSPLVQADIFRENHPVGPGGNPVGMDVMEKVVATGANRFDTGERFFSMRIAPITFGLDKGI